MSTAKYPVLQKIADKEGDVYVQKTSSKDESASPVFPQSLHMSIEDLVAENCTPNSACGGSDFDYCAYPT